MISPRVSLQGDDWAVDRAGGEIKQLSRVRGPASCSLIQKVVGKRTCVLERQCELCVTSILFASKSFNLVFGKNSQAALNPVKMCRGV